MTNENHTLSPAEIELVSNVLGDTLLPFGTECAKLPVHWILSEK